MLRFGHFGEWLCNSISENIHPTFRYLEKQFQLRTILRRSSESLQIIKN